MIKNSFYRYIHKTNIFSVDFDNHSLSILVMVKVNRDLQFSGLNYVIKISCKIEVSDKKYVF
jgi:hypothetical protein